MLKFKKYQKGKLNNRFNTELLNIYQYRSKSLILKTQTFGKCSINQIKSLKQILNKKTKRIKSQVFLNIPTTVPITKKPLEVRMGKGKGNVYTYVSKLKKGSLICKINYIHFNQRLKLKKIIKNAALRISIKTKIK